MVALAAIVGPEVGAIQSSEVVRISKDERVGWDGKPGIHFALLFWVFIFVFTF
jgi:hypothetical protein